MNTDRSIGQRVWSGFLRIVSTAFILGLAGLVAYLASERNARTYSLSAQKGQLVVHKGRMWPWGTEPWKPNDPALADAYAPIPLEDITPEGSLLQQTFGDRDELDRALFGVLDQLARPRIASDDPKEVDRGVHFVRRMQNLSGLTQEQRASVEKLQSEFAWYLARFKLEQARQILSDALGQLDLASVGSSKNAQKANQLAAEIAQPARYFEESLRRALGGMAPTGAGRTPTLSPGPGPTPPPETPTLSPAPGPTPPPTTTAVEPERGAAPTPQPQTPPRTPTAQPSPEADAASN